MRVCGWVVEWEARLRNVSFFLDYEYVSGTIKFNYPIFLNVVFLTWRGAKVRHVFAPLITTSVVHVEMVIVS